MTTENEQPAAEQDAGLEADLGAAFDKATEEPESPEVPEVKEEKEVKETEEKSSPEPEATEEPVIEEPQVEEPSKEVVPPASWTADAKEKFGDLDPVLKEEVLKREKDYAKGIQKYSDLAKQAEQFDQVVAPYKAMIAAEGSDPVRAVQSLLNTAYQLRSGTTEQKSQLILQLANQYGADLSQVNGISDEDEYIDPDIKSLKDEISSLKQTTESQMQAAQNQQVQTYQEQINAFAADPKNSHFEQVQGQMSSLLTSGAASTLEEAYEKSLYLVPEIREEIIQKQVKDAESERVKKETDAAAKAKKAAGTQLKNEEAGIVMPEDGTMEDDLAAAYDKATSA